MNLPMKKRKRIEWLPIIDIDWDDFCNEWDSIKKVNDMSKVVSEIIKAQIKMPAVEMRRIAIVSPGILDSEALSEFDLYGKTEKVVVNLYIQDGKLVSVNRELLP